MNRQDEAVRELPRPRRRRERSPVVRILRLVASRNPRTFTEKVCYKMLRDHRDLLVTFADKAAVRDYIAEAVGEQYLPALVAVFDSPEQLRSLPHGDSYAIKPTHGSGAVLIVSDEAPVGARLVKPEWGWVYQHVRPEHVHPDALVATGESWLTKLYGQGPNREWAYSRVPPRIIVEELLSSPTEAIPDDLKFFVFHGTCHYIQVDSGRFGARTQDFFTPAWQHLDLSGGPPWCDPPKPKPTRLTEMITLAERLARETDFLRVDLYHLPDRVVVGELTSYPAGGHSPFDPESWDAAFGAHWTVPKRYR